MRRYAPHLFALLALTLCGGLPLLSWAASIDVPVTPSNGLSNKEWFHLSIGMLGGLAFMLYGIDKMGTALKVVAGDKMKRVAEIVLIHSGIIPDLFDLAVDEQHELAGFATGTNLDTGSVVLGKFACVIAAEEVSAFSAA